MPGGDGPGVLAGIERTLERGRELGLIGPGPVGRHIRHAMGFVELIRAVSPRKVLDLGSGAGLPGLVVATMLDGAAVVLLEAGARRASFLRAAAAELGMLSRVTVLHERAEEAGRVLRWRETFDAVTARSFGAPAVTAECGAPFVRVGGVMVVSNPPGQQPPPPPTPQVELVGPPRWPAAGLETLGLLPGRVESVGGFSFQVLAKAAPCPDRYPRRSGLPERKPLF